MEKLFYSHDYTNDTTYTFERDPDGRGQITMTFTSEDPDYGTEELIYGGYDSESELRGDLLKEIEECLDLREAGKPIPEHLRYYDEDFAKTSLIAFNNMLFDMMDHYVSETAHSLLAERFPSYHTYFGEAFYDAVSDDVKVSSNWPRPNDTDVSLAVQRVILREMGVSV